MRKLAWLAILSAFAAAAPLAAGTAIKVERRDLPNGTPSATVISVQGERVAITGAGERVIFKNDEQKMLIVDDAKKSYVAIDAAMMQGISTQVSAAMKEMEAAIAQLPPEQQAMARKMMQQQQQQQQQPPPASARQRSPGTQQSSVPVQSTREVRPTTERETREGYPCVKYEVFDSGTKVRELWVTDWTNVQGHAELAQAMKNLDGFTKKLTSAVGSLGGSMGAASVAKWWDGIDGMPVVTTEFKNDAPVEESVVRSVEAADIERTAFEVPADYTEKKVGG